MLHWKTAQVMAVEQVQVSVQVTKAGSNSGQQVFLLLGVETKLTDSLYATYDLTNGEYNIEFSSRDFGVEELAAGKAVFGTTKSDAKVELKGIESTLSAIEEGAPAAYFEVAGADGKTTPLALRKNLYTGCVDGVLVKASDFMDQQVLALVDFNEAC